MEIEYNGILFNKDNTLDIVLYYFRKNNIDTLAFKVCCIRKGDYYDPSNKLIIFRINFIDSHSDDTCYYCSGGDYNTSNSSQTLSINKILLDEYIQYRRDNIISKIINEKH